MDATKQHNADDDLEILRKQIKDLEMNVNCLIDEIKELKRMNGVLAEENQFIKKKAVVRIGRTKEENEKLKKYIKTLESQKTQLMEREKHFSQVLTERDFREEDLRRQIQSLKNSMMECFSCISLLE